VASGLHPSSDKPSISPFARQSFSIFMKLFVDRGFGGLDGRDLALQRLIDDESDVLIINSGVDLRIAPVAGSTSS